MARGRKLERNYRCVWSWRVQVESSGSSRKAGIDEVAAGVWPFILLILLTVVLLYAFPGLALYIPFQL